MTGVPSALPDPVATGSPLAPSLFRRMACFVYEALLLFGLGLVPGLLGAIFFAQTGQHYPLQTDSALRVFAFVFYGIYFVWFWSTRGQTLAMQTWHIRMETLAGERPSQQRSAVRYLAACAWFLPAALVTWLAHLSPWQSLASFAVGIGLYALLSLSQREHQFWHDVACGTRLIDARANRQSPHAATR